MQTTTRALVLALASTLWTHTSAAGFELDTPEWEKYWSQLSKKYRGTKPRQFAYGKTEFAPSIYIGEIDPPFVTPDPERVEVISFETYGHRGWDNQLPAPAQVGQNAAGQRRRPPPAAENR